MREILFRGKNSNGNWIYGNLNYYPDINRTFIRKNAKEILPSFRSSLEEEVNKNTVGQFTGLIDKNGTKIFEGDIVVTSIKGNNTVCKVTWADNVAQFQLWQFHTIPNTSTALNLGNYDCEVIGNIHDNPELLKEREG